MGISILKIRDNYNNPDYKKYILDSDSDLSNLPALEECAPGSEAYSIESGKTFILSNAGEWAEKLGV